MHSHQQHRLTRAARGLAASAALLALWSASALGQTRFAWPDTAVDIAKYTTVDDCAAVIQRSTDHTESAETLADLVWRDTMPADRGRWRRSTSAPVRETARRCLARFTVVDSVSFDDFILLVPLYLAAGWDDKAGALVARRLGAADAKDTKRRTALIDSVLGRYLAARPARLDSAEALLETRIPKDADPLARLDFYRRLMSAADSLRDSARTRRTAMKLSALFESMTLEERQALAEKSGREIDALDRMLFAAFNHRYGRGPLLDSLRRSTPAYLKIMRANWARATGMRPEALQFPMGERAPEISADFWFHRDDSSASRPRAGRVSLVVHLEQLCFSLLSKRVPGASLSLRAGCMDAQATLRRLAERFPTLDITVVTQTGGNFIYQAKPLAPAEEAALIAKALDHHRTPGAVAVSEGKYWRLPEGDDRRINEPDPNVEKYSFGKSWPAGWLNGFLIDTDGVIVHSATMTPGKEAEFAELIEVLLQRQPASGS